MVKKALNKPLPVIFFTIFLDLIGFGILIPVIPLLLANPHSSFYLLPPDFSPKDGYILLGYLLAIFPFMQFLATPILGQLSDRYGRKKILAISLLGTCISYILFAIGIVERNLPLLFLARSLDGITGGNISVAQAAIADITTPENRAKNFGLIGAAFGLGFIFGPYIGGKLSDPNVVHWFSAATPFWFAACLSFLNVISVFFFFPETLKHPAKELIIAWNKSITNIMKAFQLPGIRSLFTSIFLFQGGFAFFTTFFSVFLITKFGFTQGNIGDFFSYVGIWVALSQALVTRQLSKHFSEYSIVRISLFAMPICIFLFFVPTAWWGLLFIIPFFAMFIGLSQANTTALVSRSAPREIQGEVLGINASVMALAQSVPPVLSGYIAASLTPSSPIVVSAIVIFASALVYALFYKKPKFATHLAEPPATGH